MNAVEAAEAHALYEPRLISFGAGFLLALNVVTFLLGLVIAGFATYVWTSNTGFGAGFSTGALVLAMVTGAFVFILSFVGIFGTLKRNKIALIVYAVFVFIGLTVEIIITVLLAQYLGVISTISSHSSIVGSTTATFNDFLLSVYVECCIDNKSYCSSNIPGDPFYCYPVYEPDDCPSSSNSNSTVTCFIGSSQPPIGKEVCFALGSSGLLGPATPDTDVCGGGIPVYFRQAVISLITANSKYLFIFVGVSTFLELLAIIFSVLVLQHKNVAAVVARDNHISHMSIRNPVQSGSIQMEDQLNLSGRGSLREPARTRTANSLSAAQISQASAVHPGVADAQGLGVPTRVVSVELGNGRTISIDEGSGLQIATHVED